MHINKEAIIIGVISVAFLGLMGYLIWNSSTIAPKTTVSDVSLLSNPTSHMTGSPSAKVTMVEFGDFQCPACGQAHPQIQQVLAKYKDNSDFNFVFRNFPLPQHLNALPAAEAAEAAGAQGKYWEMYDMLYENQTDWDDLSDPMDVFTGYATTLGLDVVKFKTEVSDKKYKDFIANDLSDGNKARVNATPTLFINGTQVTNFSAANIETLIDAELAK